jgi:hypothetical protein
VEEYAPARRIVDNGEEPRDGIVWNIGGEGDERHRNVNERHAQGLDQLPLGIVVSKADDRADVEVAEEDESFVIGLRATVEVVVDLYEPLDGSQRDNARGSIGCAKDGARRARGERDKQERGKDTVVHAEFLDRKHWM